MLIRLFKRYTILQHTKTPNDPSSSTLDHLCITDKEKRRIHFVDGELGFKVKCGGAPCVYEFEAYWYMGETDKALDIKYLSKKNAQVPSKSTLPKNTLKVFSVNDFSNKSTQVSSQMSSLPNNTYKIPPHQPVSDNASTVPHRSLATAAAKPRHFPVVPPHPPAVDNTSAIPPHPPPVDNTSAIPPHPPAVDNTSVIPPHPPAVDNTSAIPPHPPAVDNTSAIPLHPPIIDNNLILPPHPIIDTFSVLSPHPIIDNVSAIPPHSPEANNVDSEHHSLTSNVITKNREVQTALELTKFSSSPTQQQQSILPNKVEHAKSNVSLEKSAASKESIQGIDYSKPLLKQSLSSDSGRKVDLVKDSIDYMQKAKEFVFGLKSDSKTKQEDGVDENLALSKSKMLYEKKQSVSKICTCEEDQRKSQLTRQQTQSSTVRKQSFMEQRQPSMEEQRQPSVVQSEPSIEQGPSSMEQRQLFMEEQKQTSMEAQKQPAMEFKSEKK